MFTGLVAETGTIAMVRKLRKGLKYEVSCTGIMDRLSPGASVAVNGVCQTVTSLGKSSFMTEAVASTLEKTNIGSLLPGKKVNLEPTLRTGDPLDGHFLQGHISTTGILVSVKNSGNARKLTVRVKNCRSLGIIKEGSVGIEGISLTVSECRTDEFEVHIIPETWETTTINNKSSGSSLNIEGDYLLRGAADTYPGANLNRQKLADWGY